MGSVVQSGTVVVPPSVPPRNVVRCRHCELRQFETVNGKCRRCHQLFVDPEPIALPTPAAAAASPIPSAYNPVFDVCFWLPFVFCYLRNRAGINQRELSEIMGCPRQYVVRFETGSLVPVMAQIFRFADGIGVGVGELLGLCEWMAKGEGGGEDQGRMIG